MLPFTLDQLLVLDAIARSGTFSEAAKRLHKVPSAVSYNVQGLESALGVPLFDRSRRRAELTPEGRRVLEAARAVLTEARALDRTASDLRDGWEPELHVVVDGALPIRPFTTCIRRFADPAIPTRLRVDIEYQDGVLERLDSASADLAFTLGFDGTGDEIGYDAQPLMPLEMLLVAHPEHPMVLAPDDRATRDAHAELVVRDSSPAFAATPRASFMGSPNVVYLSDFHSKRIALLEGAGYGWIPRHFVERDLASGGLVQLNTAPNRWVYDAAIVTREGQALGRAGRLFLETLGAETP